MKYIVREGQQGQVEIQNLMKQFRTSPPQTLGGSKLAVVKDYQTLTERNVLTGAETIINQKVTSNVLQFFTEDGTKISVRPSGTEPKIKFYIEVSDTMHSIGDFEAANARTDEKVNNVMKELV